MFDNVDFANVKPTLGSMAIVTIMAVLGITFSKWFFTRFPVKGVSDLVLAV